MANYNPYNAVKGWSDAKAKYETTKAMGGDYEKFHNEAMQYKNDLVANGYANVADELTGTNYMGSLDILKRYSPDKDPNAFNADTYLTNMANLASGQTAPKMTEATQAMLNMVQGEQNQISGLMNDHYNTGKSQLDFINNFDVTKQPYYDGIMSQYKLGGEDAANGVYANGSSENSGNIDSYAAANANRQQLAFTNAGNAAALQAAQQNATNWQNLYSQMSTDLTNRDSINSQNIATTADMYATDANERANATNQLFNYINNESDNMTTLEQQRLANALNQYIADLEAGTNKYISDNNLKGQMYVSDNDLAGNKYISDNSLAGNKYMADKDYLASIIASGNSLAGLKYQADKNLEATLASLEAQKELNPDGQPYDVDQVADMVKDSIRKGEYTSRTALYNDLNTMYSLGATKATPEEVLKKIEAKGGFLTTIGNGNYNDLSEYFDYITSAPKRLEGIHDNFVNLRTHQ